MRFGDLVMTAGAAALAVAAACATGGAGRPAGAPNQPASAGAGIAAAPAQVSPEKAAAKPGQPSGAAPARDAPAAPPTARWNEIHAGLAKAETRECLGCHDERKGAHSHPVEVDYAEAARRAGTGLRPIDEVRARGLALEDGKVGCPTCHSAASPWAHFLAVPRALAVAQPTVAELRADEPEGPQARVVAGPPKEGAEVSARPLCESCHL